MSLSGEYMGLKGKKILITAGPTWVAIDPVRVISNIATAQTGLLLAEEASRRKAAVTLAVGPAPLDLPKGRWRILRFRFFEELKSILIRELRSKSYDCVIHAAAVSDFAPLTARKAKMPSGRRRWGIRLRPTQKLIGLIKRLSGSVFLVGFKFEPGVAKSRLISSGRRLMSEACADAVVANSLDGRGRYSAYILTRRAVYGRMNSKKGMAVRLISLLEGEL